MLHRNHGGKTGALDPAAMDMLDEASKIASGIEGYYRTLDFSKVVKEVVAIADLGNKYLQDEKPWDTVKTDEDKAHRQLTTALTLGKACVGLLKPIVPAVAEKVEAMLGMDAPGFTFANAMDLLPRDAEIAPYERLFERLDAKKVKKLFSPDGEGANADGKAANSDDKAKKKKAKEAGKKAAAKFPPDPPAEIEIDAFFQTELRAAKVIEAGDVEGADKLIRLKLDVGDLGERQVFWSCSSRT
jgi:methionyl-tRNA synthetase